MVSQEISSVIDDARRQSVEAAQQRRTEAENYTYTRARAQQIGTEALELVRTFGIDEDYEHYTKQIYDATFSGLIPMGKYDAEDASDETFVFGRVYVMRRKESKLVTTSRGRVFRQTERVVTVTDQVDTFGVAWYTGSEDGSDAAVVSDLHWSVPNAGNVELVEEVAERVELIRAILQPSEPRL